MLSTNQATVNNAIPGLLLLPKRHEEPQTTGVPKRGQTRLQKQFDSILKGIKSPVKKDLVESVFVSLSRLCDLLKIIEINTNEGGSLPVSLAAFSLIDEESKALVSLIERKLSKIKSIKGTMRHALDRTSFVLRHELKRVFSQELAMLSSEWKANQISADVMRAHGLLSNCFQQSIIILAQEFDPLVSSKLLFEGYRDRLEQSNILLRDLSRFVALAGLAAERQDSEANDLIIQELKSFCNGPLHYLMYKDWEEFEDIAREVTASYGSARYGFILHCFVAYLEALLNQVQMRAVLNERSPERQQPKTRKKANR